MSTRQESCILFLPYIPLPFSYQYWIWIQFLSLNLFILCRLWNQCEVCGERKQESGTENQRYLTATCIHCSTRKNTWYISKLSILERATKKPTLQMGHMLTWCSDMVLNIILSLIGSILGGTCLFLFFFLFLYIIDNLKEVFKIND